MACRIGSSFVGFMLAVVGAASVPEACQEGEICGSSMLMRSTHSLPGSLALVEEGTEPSYKHSHSEQSRNQRRAQTETTLAEVQALAEKVMHEGKKIDNVTRAALSTIRTLMEGIINFTSTEHDEDQAEVNQARTAIMACNTKATTDLVDVSNENTIVGQDRDAHNSCRNTEVTKLTDKITKCNAFQTYASGLTPPACAAAFPPGPSDNTLTCIQEMATWSMAANVTYPLMKSDCDTATTVHSETQEGCNTKQGTFESAFCSYAELLTKSCSDQTWCRNATITARDATHASVGIAEAARGAEYGSAKHVMCYLDVLNATQEQMPTLFAACNGATYSTSHLVITYPSIPSETPCDTSPVATKPCDSSWLSTEYASQTDWYEESDWNSYTSATEMVQPQTCAVCVTTALAAAYVGSRGADGFPTGVFTGNPRFPSTWQWDTSIMQPGTTTGNVANFNSATFLDGFCGVQWNGEISQVTVALLMDSYVAFAWSDDGSNWYESPSGSMSTPHSGFTGSGKVLTPPSQARYFGVTSGNGYNRCISIAIESAATTTTTTTAASPDYSYRLIAGSSSCWDVNGQHPYYESFSESDTSPAHCYDTCISRGKENGKTCTGFDTRSGCLGYYDGTVTQGKMDGLGGDCYAVEAATTS